MQFCNPIEDTIEGSHGGHVVNKYGRLCSSVVHGCLFERSVEELDHLRTILEREGEKLREARKEKLDWSTVRRSNEKCTDWALLPRRRRTNDLNRSYKGVTKVERGIVL
jgi:hypothetical protein